MINYKKADLNELDEIISCRMEFIRVSLPVESHLIN